MRTGRKRREEWRAQAVAADLDQLDKLRRYLIFDTRAREPARELIDAIDDYVENRHIVRAFNPDRKDHHWEKRKLKRDE